MVDVGRTGQERAWHEKWQLRRDNKSRTDGQALGEQYYALDFACPGQTGKAKQQTKDPKGWLLAYLQYGSEKLSWIHYDTFGFDLGHRTTTSNKVQENGVAESIWQLVPLTPVPFAGLFWKPGWQTLSWNEFCTVCSCSGEHLLQAPRCLKWFNQWFEVAWVWVWASVALASYGSLFFCCRDRSCRGRQGCLSASLTKFWVTARQSLLHGLCDSWSKWSGKDHVGFVCVHTQDHRMYLLVCFYVHVVQF